MQEDVETILASKDLIQRAMEIGIDDNNIGELTDAINNPERMEQITTAVTNSNHETVRRSVTAKQKKEMKESMKNVRSRAYKERMATKHKVIQIYSKKTKIVFISNDKFDELSSCNGHIEGLTYLFNYQL